MQSGAFYVLYCFWKLRFFISGPFSHYFHGVHEQTHIFYVMAHSGCLGPFKNEPHCPDTMQETTTPKNLSVRSTESSIVLSLVVSILLWKLIK